MTGNAEQERLQEALFKWQLDARKNKTPVEKLRRKGWRGRHYRAGGHEWTLNDDGKKWPWPAFEVVVEDRDGWRYAVRRDWWPWRDKSKHIHGGPFASDVEAALAGIECAELLRADLQWMATDDVGRVINQAAGEAESKGRMLSFAVRELAQRGNTDLAEALQQGHTTVSEAFHEQRQRVAARELASADSQPACGEPK